MNFWEFMLQYETLIYEYKAKLIPIVVVLGIVALILDHKEKK